MKKILSSALVALAAVSLNSCAEFLQPTSEGSYSTDNYFTSDSQAIDAADACYYLFLDECFLGREIMWEEAAANDLVWGRTRSWPELATMSMTTSCTAIDDVWRYDVRAIARANWVVSSLLKVQESRTLTAIESRSLGEAYFCRALAHFYLAYRYGTAEQGVPFVKYEDFEGGYNNEIPTQNASVIDDYKMIIEDLDAAEQLVPRYEDYSDADFGRVHKAACAGIKAKVYTYWACWDKSQYANVITEVNKMESQYGRSISGVAFTDNFTSDYSKWRNSEYVWTIPSEGGPQGIYGGVEFCGVTLDNGLYGLFNCWGQFKPSLDIYEEMSKDNDCLFAVADLHAITVRQDPAKFREQIRNMYALLFAIGLDPEKNIIFVQSQVPTHAQLGWILDCYTQFGELSRMTQFKDKSAKHADNINAGLFTYPTLMAADILLYNTDLVPVGIDQKQHIELARNIAERFNGLYSNTFKIPEPYIPKLGAKIMSLTDPTKKMSKSDENPNSFVAILDSEDTIIKKFKRAVTDSEAEVVYRDGKDGINNLMSIYSSVTGKSFEEIEREFDGRGYGDFKLAVGTSVADHLKPVRDEFERLMNDKAYLEECYRDGAEKALAISQRMLDKVYKKIGFVR